MLGWLDDDDDDDCAPDDNAGALLRLKLMLIMLLMVMMDQPAFVVWGMDSHASHPLSLLSHSDGKQGKTMSESSSIISHCQPL